MDAEITKSDGTSFLLSDYGFVVRDFNVESIGIESVYSDIEGGNGRVDMGASYTSRNISVPLMYKARDYHDFVLARDELFRLLSDVKSFYIRELRRVEHYYGHLLDKKDKPSDKYVGGKRYKVRVSDVYNVEQTYLYGFVELEFHTTELPFAESIGTSMDIHSRGINADDGMWGFGMGLEAVDETLIYKHNAVAGKAFRIFNPGVAVHPFEQQLKMRITNVRGSTEMFQITNLTNGSRTRVRMPLNRNDVVLYDGHFVTRNNLNILRDTSRKFVELSPGWNRFMIYYCDSATVELDFPFYYL